MADTTPSRYVPNFSLLPSEIALALINNDNNKGYTLSDINFKAPVALDGHATGKNTELESDLLVDPSEVDGDFVAFHYDRMTIGAIFDEVVTAGANNLREVEVKDSEGQIIVANVISEVSRKYGFAINVTDFEITMPTASQVRVSAKPENMAYIGNVTFVVDSGLSSRVSITKLDGFTGLVAPVV